MVVDGLMHPETAAAPLSMSEFELLMREELAWRWSAGAACSLILFSGFDDHPESGLARLRSMLRSDDLVTLLADGSFAIVVTGATAGARGLVSRVLAAADELSLVEARVGVASVRGSAASSELLVILACAALGRARRGPVHAIEVAGEPAPASAATSTSTRTSTSTPRLRLVLS